jgi:hypothetical protein
MVRRTSYLSYHPVSESKRIKQRIRIRLLIHARRRLDAVSVTVTVTARLHIHVPGTNRSWGNGEVLDNERAAAAEQLRRIDDVAPETLRGCGMAEELPVTN